MADRFKDETAEIEDLYGRLAALAETGGEGGGGFGLPLPPEQRGKGRPTKLTPETLKDMRLAILQGLPKSAAAEFAGISPRTYHYWVAVGKEDIEKGNLESPCAIFCREIGEAERKSELLMAGALYKASREGEWRAAAFVLERRFPDRWGRVDRLAVKAKVETRDMTDRQQEVSKLTPAQLGRRMFEHQDALVGGALSRKLAQSDPEEN